VRAALAALLLMVVLVEPFVPTVTRASFGYSLALETRTFRPPQAVLDLYQRMGPGAVLDVPYELDSVRVFSMADYVLFSAYHHHLVAAHCTTHPGHRPLDEWIHVVVDATTWAPL
jgi:hypothetical protein